MDDFHHEGRIEELESLVRLALNAATSGAVASVSGSPPITSTGGANPVIGITPATPLAAGSMSAADKAEVDALAVSTVGAGAGLTGGGLIDASPVLNVGANADGSIVVNANDVQVGILATDAQHGIRGGGTQHAVATPVVAGFMSAADKTKLDGITALATPAVLLWGADAVGTTTTTRFLTPGFDNVLAPTTAVQFRIPFAGTLRNMRVRQGTGGGNGNAIVYTVRKNSAATALTVSMASTANDGSDLADTVAVAAGDLLDIRVTKALALGGGQPSTITVSVELSS